MTHTDSLAGEVISLVESVVLRSVEGNTRLLDTGLVDSVLAVEIVMAVELQFGVRIPSTEIAEHLVSANTMTRFIAANL